MPFTPRPTSIKRDASIAQIRDAFAGNTGKLRMSSDGQRIRTDRLSITALRAKLGHAQSREKVINGRREALNMLVAKAEAELGLPTGAAAWDPAFISIKGKSVGYLESKARLLSLARALAPQDSDSSALESLAIEKLRSSQGAADPFNAAARALCQHLIADELRVWAQRPSPLPFAAPFTESDIATRSLELTEMAFETFPDKQPSDVIRLIVAGAREDGFNLIKPNLPKMEGLVAFAQMSPADRLEQFIGKVRTEVDNMANLEPSKMAPFRGADMNPCWYAIREELINSGGMECLIKAVTPDVTGAQLSQLPDKERERIILAKMAEMTEQQIKTLADSLPMEFCETVAAGAQAINDSKLGADGKKAVLAAFYNIVGMLRTTVLALSAQDPMLSAELQKTFNNNSDVYRPLFDAIAARGGNQEI